MDITLALGGGGVKGIAHLGVIRRLEQAGCRIRAVAGTSAGGLVGSLYASGLSSDQIIHLIERMATSRLFQRSPHDGPSLVGLTGFSQILLDALGNRSFGDLKIPFACTAVDVRCGKEYVFREGCLVDAVLATIAVPGVFPPKRIGNSLLVDGGILDPVPVSLARALAPALPVVAVVLSPIPDKWADLPMIHLPITTPIPVPLIESLARLRFAQAFQIFVQSVDISSRELTELRLAVDRPEVIIRPDVDRFGILDQVDPKQRSEMLQAGDTAAKAAISEIQEVTSFVHRLARKLRRYDPLGINPVVNA